MPVYLAPPSIREVVSHWQQCELLCIMDENTSRDTEGVRRGGLTMMMMPKVISALLTGEMSP